MNDSDININGGSSLFSDFDFFSVLSESNETIQQASEDGNETNRGTEQLDSGLNDGATTAPSVETGQSNNSGDQNGTGTSNSDTVTEEQEFQSQVLDYIEMQEKNSILYTGVVQLAIIVFTLIVVYKLFRIFI